MGLTIKKYDYSYQMLASIKKDVLVHEGLMSEEDSFFTYDFNKALKTKYPEFILHSDAEGLYISKSSKQYNKLHKKWLNRVGVGKVSSFVGDLDKLKKEVEDINNYVKLKKYSSIGFTHFYYDVMNAKKILELY